ncbi:uncharacterized protein si:dkey-9i23.16 [Hippocampus zosterae]|uniref:uncharacterized protein si:dkey-9i23.16 n=1 Tax=Hippocampus zosterae TaxID=109293 RepID=UPI00223D7585|nr:uncharacterized protein si:dkey-9i23.16 [Hippocampus zosterae]
MNFQCCNFPFWITSFSSATDIFLLSSSALVHCLKRKMPMEGLMSSNTVRIQHIFSWFDMEAAAVVTIILGLFQLLLTPPLAYTDHRLPNIFILPLVTGIIIVAGGSFTLANKRNPSRPLLLGSACSNGVGFLSALLALCLYCFRLNSVNSEPPCTSAFIEEHGCPADVLLVHCWRVTLLLLLYDIGAIVLHVVFSVNALKALKNN